MDILNEVYFGQTPGITRCFEYFSKFRQKYLTHMRVFTYMNSTHKISADHDEDLYKFCREMEKEFGFYSFSFMVWNDDIPNMMTLPIQFNKNRIGMKKEDCITVTKSGMKFNPDLKISIIVIAPTALLFNEDYSDREIFAALLHEIGHNFQRYINGTIGVTESITSVTRMINQIIKAVLNPHTLFPTLFGMTLTSVDFHNFISKQYNALTSDPDANNLYSYFNFLNGLKHSLTELPKSAKNLLIPFRIDKLLKNTLYGFISLIMFPITSLNDYLGERQADNFASYYGFGGDLSLFMAKFRNVSTYWGLSSYITSIPLIGHFYKFTTVPLHLLTDIIDCHPGSGDRIYSITTSMKNELKNNGDGLDPKLKKELEKDIKRTEEQLDIYYKEATKVENTAFLIQSIDRFIITKLHGTLKYKSVESIFKLDKTTDETIRKRYVKEGVDSTMRNKTFLDFFLESDDEDEKDKNKKSKKDDDENFDYTTMKDDDDDEDEPNDYVSSIEDNNKDIKVDVHVSLGESFVNEYF